MENAPDSLLMTDFLMTRFDSGAASNTIFLINSLIYSSFAFIKSTPPFSKSFSCIRFFNSTSQIRERKEKSSPAINVQSMPLILAIMSSWLLLVPNMALLFIIIPSYNSFRAFILIISLSLPCSHARNSDSLSALSASTVSLLYLKYSY